MAANRQAVLSFSEGKPSTHNPRVRGGKGASLTGMAALGLPVPPGFTLSTSVSRAFNEHGRLPKRVLGQVEREIAKLERQTGKGFGNPENPLLVSIRSGAAVSMPGMMDTILNVGINANVLDGLANQYGENFAYETFSRFYEQFGKLVSGVVPEDPWDQLMMAIEAVLRSWWSERAVTYRQSRDLDDRDGTAVNVQAMVFGHRDQSSGTGVVFSCNPSSGERGMFGEWLPCAQGEELVSGVRTPQPVSELCSSMPAVYAELERYVTMLTERNDTIMDVEFTVESGKLYILQSRTATRTPQAAASFAVHQEWAKRWDKRQALEFVTSTEVQALSNPGFDPDAVVQARVLAQGLSASAGTAVGRVAFSTVKAQEYATSGQPAVLVRHDTTPDDLEGMLASVAIVTAVGGATCHAAVVARGMRVPVPAVVGTGHYMLDHVPEGEWVSVDGTRGLVLMGRLPLVEVALPKEANIFLRWHERYGRFPEPRLAFERVNERHSANQLLNDFYLSEQMAASAAGSKLAVEAEQLSREVQIGTAELLATYLAIAIVGEARYYDHSYATPEADLCQNELATDFGLSLRRDREEAWRWAIRELPNHDLTSQARFAELIEGVFEKGSWGGSIGGTRWAAIARALKVFLLGDQPYQLFIDHVFDLVHNGGVLFNKHNIVREERMGDGRGINRQLDIKKAVSGATELHTQLAPFGGFSEQVAALYAKGHGMGLW